MHVIQYLTRRAQCFMGGRWNSPGQRVIYAAESYAGARLEVLVHASLSVPPKHHRVVRISIAESAPLETLQPAALPDWDAEDCLASRQFGDKWLIQKRTVVVKVPSVVTEGRENTILTNPAHPRFERIQVSDPERIRWDARLFRSGP